MEIKGIIYRQIENKYLSALFNGNKNIHTNLKGWLIIMMNYNYLEAMKEDIKDYIRNDAELDANDLHYNRSDLEEKLHDDLWTCDSVTGNASGSYFCNSYKSMECVLDNIDLLHEMCNEFGIEAETIGQKFLDEEWEWMDVSIRCYLLGQAISEVLDEIEEELEEEIED